MLDTDRTVLVTTCIVLPYTQPIAPANGVRIDEKPWLWNPAGGGACPVVNDLRVCVSGAAPYSILVLKVTVPGRSKPVYVSIGLAGNGMVARTILYSLRVA